MQTASVFDARAAEWDANPIRVDRARTIAGSMARILALKSTDRIMDYGTGTGLIALSLLPFVEQITAVDTSQGMLDALGRKLKDAGIRNIHPRFWNLETLPFPETGFNAMVSSMTLHHVRDVPAVLRHSFTLLVPGGRLAVADLDTEDGSFHSDPTGVHHRGFDRTWIREQLASAGFQSVSVTDVCEMPRMLPDGTTRTYPLFLATAIRP